MSTIAERRVAFQEKPLHCHSSKKVRGGDHLATACDGSKSSPYKTKMQSAIPRTGAENVYHLRSLENAYEA